MSLFPTLKDEKYNDQWHRSFMTQARAQDVDKILDETYVPTTQEKDLFAEQYAVLETKVMTDVGKSIVRKHENDYDAQQVYMKLKAHHLKSTKAMIDSSEILAYITSARFGNREWKGSIFLHWQDHVRQYERQVPITDHFSDGQKRVMLETAVKNISELRQVKNTADMEKAKTGVALSYDQYSALLLSAAVNYDAQQTLKRTKNHVFAHEFQTHEHDVSNANSFDIEAPVSIINAHAALTANKFAQFGLNQHVS